MVFHYHAGGLSDCLNSAGLLGKIGIFVYSEAGLSVGICKIDFSPGRVFHARETVFVPNGLDVELVAWSCSYDELYQNFVSRAHQPRHTWAVDAVLAVS